MEPSIFERRDDLWCVSDFAGYRTVDYWLSAEIKRRTGIVERGRTCTHSIDTAIYTTYNRQYTYSQEMQGVDILSQRLVIWFVPSFVHGMKGWYNISTPCTFCIPTTVVVVVVVVVWGVGIYTCCCYCCCFGWEGEDSTVVVMLLILMMMEKDSSRVVIDVIDLIVVLYCIRSFVSYFISELFCWKKRNSSIIIVRWWRWQWGYVINQLASE